jgi:hypothetical protein
MRTSKSHNKKRNSILLYEFLVSSISKSLVEDDKRKSSAALKILKRHFKKGTNLYKEFRLLNSLIKTSVTSPQVASRILKEAKDAAIKLDTAELDREKSLLIRNINHSINNDNSFYDQHINEYRMCATIQQLINEWQSEDSDITKIAEYEDQLVHWLLSPKKNVSEHTISEESSGTSRLLMAVMSKKLNEKYSNVLNEQQKNIIKAYALTSMSNDTNQIAQRLEEVRTDLSVSIDAYIEQIKDLPHLKSKLVETKQELMSENFEKIDDALITKFMIYSKLNLELDSKE